MDTSIQPDWSGSLRRVADYIGSIVESDGVIAPDSQPGLTVATVLATRTARNLRAIDLLAGAGFDIESHAIGRMILEDMFDLGYIAAGPEVRAQEWCDHCMVRRVFYARDSLTYDPQVHISPEVVAANQRISDEDLASGRSRRSRDWKLWPDVHRRERARQAGLGGIYDDEYVFHCDLAHSSGLAIQLYSTTADEDGRVPALTPQGVIAAFAARSALDAALRLCATARRLGLPWDHSDAWGLVDISLWSYGDDT